MDKFQQGGGVYPVIPTGPDYDIPNSQGVALPPPINISVKDMTHLAYLMQNRENRAQVEAEKAALLKEQRQQALIKLKDPLFGDVDNQNQLNRLKELRKEHNVPDTLPPGLLDNPALLREYERNIYNLTSSDKYQKLRREVATARLYNDKSITDLDGDSAIAFGQAYSRYLQYGANGEMEPFEAANGGVETVLRPGIYEQAVNNQKQTNLRTAITGRLNDLIGYDLATDDGKAAVGNWAANQWALTDEATAIKEGLIVPDDSGFAIPRPTEKGLAIALQYAEAAQKGDKARRDLNAEYQAEQKRLADSIADANRIARENSGGGDSGGGKVTAADKNLAARLGIARSRFEQAFPGIPLTPEIQNYLELTATNAEGAALSAALDALFSGNEKNANARDFKRLIDKIRPQQPVQPGIDYDPFFKVSPQQQTPTPPPLPFE